MKNKQKISRFSLRKDKESRPEEKINNTDVETSGTLYFDTRIFPPKNFLRRSFSDEIKRRIGLDNIIVLFGMGGMGKTTLLISLLMELYDDGNITKIAYFDLKNRLDFVSFAKSTLREVFGEKVLDGDCNLIDKLIQYFLRERVLIVLDNLESIMYTGDKSGGIIDEYGQYWQFIESVVALDTESTLILSGRDKIDLGSRYDDNYTEYRIPGLDSNQAKDLLIKKHLVGTDEEWENFVKIYNGNPLELKIVASKIEEEYQSNIKLFLENPNMPRELQVLLEEQFDRFNFTEKSILFWLAVERESMTKEYIRNRLVIIDASQEIIDQAFENILNRCFVEVDLDDFSSQRQYYLQPVIMEFLAKKLIASFISELSSKSIHFLAIVPLIDTDAKEYIVAIQKLLLIIPLKNALVQQYGKTLCKQMILDVNSSISYDRSYACGNIINILSSLDDIVENVDFSEKYIINADFRYNKFVQCKFIGSSFEHVLFRQTFGNLIDVKFSYDDNLILGGATDYSINAWDSKDLSFQFKLCHHTDWVRSVDSNHKYIVSASNDETLSVFCYNTHRLIASYSVGSRARKVRLSLNKSDTLYSSGDDKKIYIWDIITGKHIELEGHNGVVWDFAVIKVNNLLEHIISVSDDKTARLWNLESKESSIIFTSDSEIKSIAYDDVDRIFLGCADGKIIVYSLSQKCVVITLHEHREVVWGLDYDINSNRLLSGSSDKHVILWDVSNDYYCSIKVLDAHNSTIWSVNFNKSGTRFVTTGDDGEFKVWDSTTYNMLFCVKGHTNLLRNIATNEKRNSIFVGGDDTIIREFNDINYDECLQIYEGHTNRVRHIDISEDGEWMLSCGDDGKVILWNLLTRETRIYVGHQKRVWAVCFINNETFASAGEENDIYLWKSYLPTPIAYLKGHTNWIWDLTFDKKNNLLISAGEDQTCCIWDIANRQLKNTLHGHSKWLFSATISPNGQFIITGSADGTANIYDVSTGKICYSLVGHVEWVWSAIFISNDIVITGGKDCTIRIWKLDGIHKEATCIKILQAHKSWVVSLAYLKENNKFYSASADETVKVWDATSFEYVADLHLDKPYDFVDITSATGLNKTERESLLHLGAVDNKK